MNFSIYSNNYIVIYLYCLSNVFLIKMYMFIVFPPIMTLNTTQHNNKICIN